MFKPLLSPALRAATHCLVLGGLALTAWPSVQAQPASPVKPPARPEGPSGEPKIFKYLKGGSPTFSDVPPSKGAYVVYQPSCFACNLYSNIDWHTTPLRTDEYRAEIDLAARQFDLDPALVLALIHAESGFDPRARSPKGAMGLMQLMPGTARMLGVTDAYAPGSNIRGGAKYLAGLLKRFKGDTALAAAAYNAGPEAVQRYAGVPPFAETRVYVQRVKILHRRYADHLRG
ncbi:MAG: lytic transglycosylase [Burkholderiales bacterium PBB3]|nr:MAG: lytic transglycosylase [Burkholderiales bacterium PBB3]